MDAVGMDVNLLSQGLEVKGVMDGIDHEYIWQRRLQKSAVSFPDCAQIGLDFDVAHKRKEKLDMELLTNGIVLDICDFAKAANKAEKYFICEILEYNFDLGIDGDIQRTEFATCVQESATVMKDTMKNDLKQRQEVFVLPDPKMLTLSCKSSLTRECHGKPQEISEVPGISVEGSRNGDVNLISSDPIKADANGELKSETIIHKPRELKLNRDLYPFCAKFSLDLDIRPKGEPKQKLHLDLLTKGVMNELSDFAKVLSGSFYEIVFDVLEHNFDLDLQSGEAKAHNARKKIRWVLGREEKLNSGLQELRDVFRKERLSFENIPTNVRKGEVSTAPSCQRLNVITGRQLNLRNNQEETYRSSEMRCSSETTKTTEMVPRLLHVKKEDDEISISCEIPAAPLSSNTTDESHKEDQRVASDPKQKRYYTNKEQVSDLFSEETNTDLYIHVDTETASNHNDVQNPKTKQKMWWRMRSARSKEILVSCKGSDPYGHCREIGLDFNVGSGRKQSLDLQLMTHAVLLEISKFATQMIRAHIFFVEILENNFNICFDNDEQRKRFPILAWHKVKPVINITGPGAREVFELPIIKEKKASSDSQLIKEEEASSDLQLIKEEEASSDSQLIKEEGDSDSQPALSRTQIGMEPYPFCREIGLNLHEVGSCKQEKLSLRLLTNGVVNEMATFAKILAGSLWPIVHEILEHNFDLDLQSGMTELAKRIQENFSQVRNRIQKKLTSKTQLNTPIQMKSVRKRAPQTTRPRPEGTRLKEVMKKRRLDMETEKERRIVSTTGEKPIQPCSKKRYPLCESIGLDLWQRPVQDADVCETAKTTQTVPRLLHVKKEDDEMSISYAVPAASLSSNSSDESHKEDQRVASDSKQKRYYTNKEQVSDLFSEETDTEMASNHDNVQNCKIIQKMLWRSRSAHSKEILSVSCKGIDPYGHCRKIGLDFNVGSGRKQSLDLQLLTYGVLFEVSKFARQMNKARISLLTEILENNFNICFDNDEQRKIFKLRAWNNINKLVHVTGPEAREVFEVPIIKEKLIKEEEASSDSQLIKEEEASSDSQPALSRTQTGMEPYPFCREIGLNLHAVGSCKLEKLSLRLLTNGVVNEMDTFAKSLAGSLWQIVHEILEHNFDLDLQSGTTELAKHIQNSFHSVKSRILNKNGRYRSSGTDRWLSTPIQIRRRVRCVRRSAPQTTRPGPEGARLKEVLKKRRLDVETEKERRIVSTGEKSTQTCWKKPYPLCESIGLDLFEKIDWLVGKPEVKSKLDLSLLTRGVVYEIHRFLKEKYNPGIYSRYLYRLLDYNFDLSSQSLKMSDLEKQVKAVVYNKLGRMNGNENTVFPLPFKYTAKAVKRGYKKQCGSHSTQSPADAYWPDWQRPVQDTDVCETDQHYWSMETESQIDMSNGMMNTSVKQEAMYTEQSFPQQSTVTSVGSARPFQEHISAADKTPDSDHTSYWGEETYRSSEMRCSSETTKTTETVPRLLHVKKGEVPAAPLSSNSSDESHKEDQRVASDPKQKRYYTNKEQVSDLFSEETDTVYIDTETASNHDNVQNSKTKQKMWWRMRSARSKEILSVSRKGSVLYRHCRKMGVDFNVGSGRKQSLDLQLMTYGVLYEISKFATEMIKAHMFFVEILENNFNICFDNDEQRKTFQWLAWYKVKPVINITGPGAREVFELPIIKEKEASSDSPLIKEEEASSDSQPALSRTQTGMEPYPFCREIGLNLHAVESCKKEKLSLRLLTNGVVNEMATFAQSLAGSLWQIVHEILEHNFDLDLQSGTTELAKRIKAKFIEVRNRIRKKLTSKTSGEQLLNTPIQIKSVRRSAPQTTLPRPECARLKEVMKKRRLDMETEKERRIVSTGEKPIQPCWKKRYPLCESIGLDLFEKIDWLVGKPEVKSKLDLSLLTRGVVYEIHRFIKNNYGNYSRDFYRLLDYNFDLSSQSHRCKEFMSDLEKQVKAVVYNKLERMNGNENIVFPLPFKYTAKAVKRGYKKQCGSHSTQSPADAYWPDWQRPVQDADVCVTDQHYWSMETESQIDMWNGMMNTTVKQEAMYTEQSFPQQSTVTSVGSARPFQEHISAADKTPDSDHTSYWGEDTASHPERQVDICRKIIHDIVMNEGTTPPREIFHRLTDVFSDGTGTDQDFQQILNKYTSEILPVLVKEYGNLSPSQQIKVSKVNEFLCGIHLINGLAHQSKMTLELWEKMISGESKFAVHMNNGMPEVVSRTELLLRNLCDFAKIQVCTMDGNHVDFRSFLTDRGEFEDIPLTATREKGISGLFKDAAGVYSICDELVEYTSNHVMNHGFLGTATADLEVQHLKAGCRALGLVSKLIIDPLWKALTSEESLLEMEMRYQTLISKLIEWQEDGRDMVEGSVCLFDDVEVRKDLVFDRLTMHTDSELFELTVQIVEVMLASFVEVCCKMLTSGIDQDLRMDVNCRKYSQIVEHLQEARLRDVSIAFRSMSTFKEKRTWKWLKSLREKQLSLFRELHYSLMHHIKIHCDTNIKC